MITASIAMSYLVASVLTALVGLVKSSRRFLDLLAMAMAIIGLALSALLAINIARGGVEVYMFGGFKPPLGIIYYADFVSSTLSLLSSFAAVVSLAVAAMTMDFSVKRYFYPLAFLLVSGAQGFLFAGDIFHLYVCTELVAVSSYALTAVYIDKKNCIRAAMVYGIAGTAVTSFLLLSTVLIYSSYGTVNMADISLKSADPSAVTPFTGGVFGDIASSSALALALMTWVLLFKSGIMPNHFWLPRVYRVAPIASLILFTSSADVLGVYGILRLYHVVFSRGSIIAGFRDNLVLLLNILSIASALLSSLLVARQNRIRSVIAYSTIAQLSLALAGVISSNSIAVAGGLLHIAVNALGDSSVLTGYTIYVKQRRGFSSVLAKALIAVGFLNLFGLLPLVPGFWSKALMVRGFLEEGAIPNAVAVLVSTGLCAVGYFRVAIGVLSGRFEIDRGAATGDGKLLAGLVLCLILLVVVLGVGLGLAFDIGVFSIVIEAVMHSTNTRRYISNILGLL